MKILQVIDSLNVGGAQKLLAEFAREISTSEHELEVIVLSQPELDSPIYKELYSLNVQTDWLPFRNIIDIHTASRL